MMTIKKRVASLLLALAVAVTMMSGMTLSTFAEDDTDAGVGINVVVNGENYYFDEEWLEEHDNGEPQIFPSSKKANNGVISYEIAQGVPIDDILLEVGLDDAGYAEGCTMKIIGGTNPVMTFEHLADATYVMKGAWDPETQTDARKYVKVSGGRARVTPIIATKTTRGNSNFKTYAEALAAIEDENIPWNEGTKTTVHIGNTSESCENHFYEGTKEEKGKIVVTPSDDCTAQYAIDNFDTIEIETPDNPTAVEMDAESIVIEDEERVWVDAWVTPWTAKFKNALTVTSEKTSIVKVGEDDGDFYLVPTGIGTTNITASCGDKSVTVPVTVKESTFKPSKPSLTVSNVKTKSAKVSWKKVSKASGYEIYRSTKKSSGYKKIKTITKGSTVSYKNTKLKKGKTYYYKVKAYRTVSGKKVYSNYSAVKSVKIKK